MTRKYVNEHFFDSKGKAPDELKAMWYILGISFPQYFSYLKQRPRQNVQYINRWQSTSEGLVGIVKSSLESEHAISPVANKHIRTGETFMTYYLVVSSEEMYESLHSIGLGVPKEEREFPDVEEQYLDHFIRGFFDAHVLSKNKIKVEEYKGLVYRRHVQELHTSFNIPFLKSLYDALVKHANVKGGREVKESPFTFSTSDVKKIYAFIYRDWDFIGKNKLYLPSKKELFEVKYDIETPPPRHIAASRERMEEAKRLLLSGMNGARVSTQLGYSSPVSFYTMFRKATGKTTRGFLRENAKKNPRSINQNL